MEAAAGVIRELWRYPVKSMAGERCDSLRLEARGVQGDRQFAVTTSDGKPGSGKNTRRFRKVDGLLEFTASYSGPLLRIRFPSGEVLDGNHADIHLALSEALGQPVTLRREGQVSHLDAAPIHLITSASLRWLESALPGTAISARRFRPNLVIDWPGDRPVEADWAGMQTSIGNEVRLAVSAATERCAMVALGQGDLPRDARVLRHIVQHAGGHFGAYARVVVPGVVRLDDQVVMEPAR